jgi:type I restriction-modification system DNA methylase subunit
MFVYFLQRKGFIDNDFNYLQNQLQASQRRGENLFYRQFLQTLFFQAFAKPESQRDASVTALVGKVKYLNGGLFLQHPLENIYQNICIDDQAFENILDLFSRYSWNLDDTPGGRDDEINPDVLGYIFEKYINQKAFGAYYTRPEITEYLCDRTINKWIVERSNQLYPRKQFASISELLINLDSPLCEILIKDILPQLSILDPACGSGAFLVAAMKTLIAIYSGVIGTIELRGDSKLKQWLAAVRKSHPSLGYYIKKRIISDNLYGVDIMEEATEIAKLRLFLALVAAAQSVTELEPLPNIDFNIMSGNSLIGLIRVDEKSFNLMGEENILQSLTAQNYQAILTEKNRSIELYKEHAFRLGEVEGTPQENRLQMLRNHIEDVNRESLVKLNQILLDEFSGKLSIKYESAQLTGKAKKRLLTLSDMQSLKPFHWGYHFDKLITEKGGFDVIITNPPWEVFKPQAKEFFSQHSDLVTKNKMDIKTFEKEQKKLLTNPEIAQAWLDYQSQYPHVSLYFRSSEQYKNQISIVNGKKQGTDINLYKLFVEQCFNLLHPQGECGMVIPSGIYTDLGTKQLREMLFSQTNVTGLFCFENRKTIFENVHRSFKIAILTFEKNKQTLSFPVEFMRHDVEELQRFPHKDSLVISVDLIRKLSPDSLSVMEFKQDIDIHIAEKMSRFPLLGETLPDTWNLKLTSEFHMTNDSYLFKTEPAKGRLPLYEGKMIHQFTHQYALPKYWLDEKEARQALLKRGEVDKGQILDYQTYRLGFRSVSSSTNERSLISSLIPKLVFCGNSLSISECEQNNFQDNQSFKIFIVAVLNSFLIDWMLRQKVSQNLNFFYIYQLPIPRLKEGDRYFEEIVENAAKLICVSEEFDELAKEVGIGSHKNGVTEETERAKIRAKLDAIVAHLYELNEIEFQHILSTFPLASESVKTATLKAYQNL